MPRSVNMSSVAGQRYWIIHIDQSHTLIEMFAIAQTLNVRQPTREEFSAFVKAEKRGTMFYSVLDDDTIFMGMHAGFGCGSDENMLIIMLARDRAYWRDTHWVMIQ